MPKRYDENGLDTQWNAMPLAARLAHDDVWPSNAERRQHDIAQRYRHVRG